MSHTLTYRVGYRTQIVVFTLAVLAFGLAYAMRPTLAIGESARVVNLDSMVPTSFGDWKVDTGIVPAQVSPDVQAEIDKIYSQTLARTYVNSKRERVMLSIAYGADQSDSLNVHMPEGCYRGQGFSIKSREDVDIQVSGLSIPVVRLFAVNGARKEPITYWLIVGDNYAKNRTERKIAQLKYSLTRQIPDGILFRVSSIGADTAREYEVQREFVDALLSGVAPADKARLAKAL